MRKMLTLLAGAALSCLVLSTAQAAGPITMIVTVPPGGSSDALARLTATALGARLNQSVVVENVTGAGGLVGMQRFLKAKADGSTLLFINQSLAILPHLYKQAGYSAVTDVAPVGIVAKVPMVLSVSNASGIQDLPGLIGKMKSTPGALNFGSGGPGTTAHFAEALFMQQAGAQGQLVQYRGSGPALTDLMAGTIQAVIDQTVTMLPLHKDGRVRALAVSSAARVPQSPDVPTFAEAGLLAFDLAIWNGVVAPTGTPAAELRRLEQALSAAVAEPAFRAQIDSMGAQAPTGDERGPGHFRQLIQQDAGRVADLARTGVFVAN
ncbi:tripartite tricarboxylate transporter substrate binding protein [Xenophilus arseniciresistens]|uniref:Tripartite tricarboxylate transporter substrate binding protein n=1 Tax=Xenophilus arseniciresistens TaxID=1283306 RepID=A0AAE3N9T6_9BURK|nr:tripartite tricarboxylate transporter substrate binding protein [Xenophilus arseniciresistens]MDA7416457.1 tripartite tricarboxylate transporter substrate binding protein [Xenophilus arseniciresistens]